MKKTFEELMQVNGELGNIQKMYPDVVKTKFGYAIKKFTVKNIQKPQEEFFAALNDIRVENALTDEKTKEILVDQTNQRGYKYSKEGLQACIKAEKELTILWEGKEFDVEPYVCTDDSVPELTEYQKEVLGGLVI